MKIVFFGTPEYVIPILESLHKTYNRGKERQLIAVVTQPPKPVGRDKKIEHSPVDNWAYKHKLPIATDINEAPIAQLGVLASYGEIIPQEVINRFEFGILNIHPSALPEFRGASPVQATILSGNEKATVTVMKMDEKMDHGPIVSTFKEDINPNDDSGTLRDRLFMKSSEFMIDLIPAYIAGKIKQKDQDHETATFTKMINKQDGFIPPTYINAAMKGNEINDEWNIRWISDYSISPEPDSIERFVRAMSPWPVAWTEVYTDEKTAEPKRLKIIETHIDNNVLVIDKVQLEGKNEVSWRDFINGYPNFRFR